MSFHQSSSSIPYDVHQLLLQVAQHGYDADDVRLWYAAILNRILYDNLSTVDTPQSQPSTAAETRETTTSTHYSANLLAMTSGPQNYANAIPTAESWPGQYSVEDYASSSISGSTTTTVDSAYQTSMTNYTQPSPCWSAGTPAQLGMNTSTTDHPTPSTIPLEPPEDTINGPAPSWPAQSSYNIPPNPSSKRPASPLPPYEFPMPSSNPMLQYYPAATTNTPPQPHFSSFESFCTAYGPPISIVPSRKRRKTSSKGVKKFFQPMHVSRSSI
ncbi:hypothetical protein BDY17DRAFT_119634 [Neohortaea acidophila]|uniref:Uncharacterized protein n=1 Tax=Neohortaea acidophila TaxID=245834 RepID=A0A6A6PXP4_9PEZI|nr:uncharacterized protein BDY17DRAFT_119634 [Neohortaea acidophila]KAF2484017.1 hypothetical protein BDY17DRAFT_119634 [Neohortaea acidophila]